MLELLKVLVQPVVLERDADGAIIGEKLAQPTPLYSAEEFAAFWATLEDDLVEQNETETTDAA
jgi:hypothetical protein